MEDFFTEDNGEYLTRMVVDVSTRSFLMYSNEGDTREVKCDTLDEFMNVLTCIRDFDELGLFGEDVVVYADPVTT